MTDEQRDIERRAGQIIWRAASLTPGVPGHASRTAVLVAEMCALIREVHAAAHQEELPTGPLFCATHGRAHWNDGDQTCRWTDPPEELPSPAEKTALTEQDRQRLLDRFPGRYR